MTPTDETFPVPPGPVTFRGRGFALLCDRGLDLRICPHCSQRLPRELSRSSCSWCAYAPDPSDVEPVRGN